MTSHADEPKGWAELSERMARAKTPEQIKEILKEMNRVLDAYEAKVGSGRRSQISPDSSEGRIIKP